MNVSNWDLIGIVFLVLFTAGFGAGLLVSLRLEKESIKAEREACAVIADQSVEIPGYGRTFIPQVAAKIRNRGKV